MLTGSGLIKWKTGMCLPILVMWTFLIPNILYTQIIVNNYGAYGLTWARRKIPWWKSRL
jgi:hypothetical protein